MMTVFVMASDGLEVDAETVDVFRGIEVSWIFNRLVVDTDIERAEVEDRNLIASEQMETHNIGKFGKNLDDSASSGGAILYDFIDNFIEIYFVVLDSASVVAACVTVLF